METHAPQQTPARKAFVRLGQRLVATPRKNAKARERAMLTRAFANTQTLQTAPFAMTETFAPRMINAPKEPASAVKL